MSSTQTITKQLLLGYWLTQYIKEYLEMNKEKYAERVLLKIDNISYEYSPAILTVLNEKKDELAQIYEPVVKTVSLIEGFEKFACESHETSVWLRNFTKPSQALILLMNKKTPEAQSLKDILSIDEIQLLSDSGFKALSNMLIREKFLSVPEVNELYAFLTSYQKITDSQLSLILNFLVAVIEKENDLLFSQKIGLSLDKLQLFKDEMIQIDNKESLKKSLQKNYLLSHLRKSNVQYLDPEKMLASVDLFIQNEVQNNYSSDVWEIYTGRESELLEKASEFVYRENKDFLIVPFSIAEKVFHFKAPSTLKEKLLNVRDNVLSSYAEKIDKAESQDQAERLQTEMRQKELEFDMGMEAIQGKKDLETIRSFRDEFSDFIDSRNLIRTIMNIENKLENPSEYNSIIEGLLSEVIVMIEDIEDDEFYGNISLIISKTSKEIIPANYLDFINYHLQSLSLLSKNIIIEKIDENEADSGNNTLPEFISFKITLQRNEETLDSTDFKVDTSSIKIENNSFFDFYDELYLNKKLGYVTAEGNKKETTFFENEIESIRAATELGDRKLLSDIESFTNFREQYVGLLRQSIESGWTIDLLKTTTSLVEGYLKNTYKDVQAVRKIHGFINKIGVIDFVESNTLASAKNVTKQVMSIFNPMRFIAYGYQLVQFGKLIEKLTDTSSSINFVRTIEDIQNYKAFELMKLSHLAPAYISTGEQNIFFFEQEESFGQGIYVTEENKQSDSSQASAFANEMTKIASDYVKIYPYAADSLDILFLYVTNLDYVKKAIESLLRKNDIHKLNVTIHSPRQAAVLYDELNKWLEAREEFTTPLPLLGGLPKLEINVLPHHSEENLESKLGKSMIDFDMAVFVDYFGQKHHLNVPKTFHPKKLKECSMEDSAWKTVHETGYRSENEGTRLINYISNTQPVLFQRFYDLQYVLQSGISLEESNTTQVLRGHIQITHTEKNALYNLVHEKFNWVVTYDKYMDPMLVSQVTNKANIIRYHVDRKGKDEVKVLVSSSESVKRFLDKTENYYYQDRLSNRLKDLLSTRSLDENVTRDIIHQVKQLSGGSVLRSLGPGKFIHELLSIYLTVTAEEAERNESSVVLWSMCDELEWFRKNQKRPDLLKLTIEYDNEHKEFNIHMKLVELKLIHYNSYESEVQDAHKQLMSGEKVLRSYFDFDENALDKEVRLQSLVKFLIEARAFNVKELSILENLQANEETSIKFYFEKEINAYIHSQDVHFEGKKQIGPGQFLDASEIEDVTVKTFTRSFILSSLQTEEEQDEKIVEDYTEEGTSFNEFIKQNTSLDLEGEEDLSSPESDSVDVEQSEPEESEQNDLEEQEESDSESAEGTHEDEDEQSQIEFPEVRALQNVRAAQNDESKLEKDKELGRQYGQILRTKFNLNNINFTVERTLVGANVIRVVGNIPSNQSFSSVEKKAKDMPLWLKVDSPPTIFSNKNGINIDINRPDPEVIYFDYFMTLVRNQISEEKLNEGFIVPIGLDPLNNVMTVDFNGTEPHMLVAGSTGSGKSVSLNSIVLSLMCLYSPGELRFVFIDPKQVEFMPFKDNVYTNEVSTNIEEAADYLDTIVEEMEQRYTLFSQKYIRNLKEFNDNVNEADEKLPRLVIVFDEFADFMLQDKELAKRIENTIARIGQKGRAAGIHMIVCTQSPKAEVINTTIKNNLLARLALKVTDSVASNVVLDTSGAENLAGKGDYLLKTSAEPVRGKSPFLQHEAFVALLNYFKK
ncbi:FtsK/SpoIIIE domain-containing protein [Domibacillus sp. 8LH]|uniref:FtsK/SpoIIIE domain-containing protein n=1 Tax=Domibacillus sp. 8LH TaxID=3073900 RepID=UPI00317EC5C9